MAKYICTACDPYDPCFYDSGRTNTEPCQCPLIGNNKPDWKPIRNEDYGKPQISEMNKMKGEL